jgi:hypothetical protein
MGREPKEPEKILSVEPISPEKMESSISNLGSNRK